MCSCNRELRAGAGSSRLQERSIKSGRIPVGAGVGSNAYASVNPRPPVPGSRSQQVASLAGPREALARKIVGLPGWLISRFPEVAPARETSLMLPSTRVLHAQGCSDAGNRRRRSLRGLPPVVPPLRGDGLRWGVCRFSGDVYLLFYGLDRSPPSAHRF